MIVKHFMEEGNLMKNGVKVLEREYLVYPHKVLLSLSDYGIYTLGGQGATGKTYLRKQLQKLQNRGESVFAFISSKPVDLQRVLPVNTSKIEIVLLDRFDLYANDDNISFLQDLAEKVVILIDSKSECVLRKLRVKGCCNITLEEDCIRVYG